MPTRRTALALASLLSAPAALAQAPSKRRVAGLFTFSPTTPAAVTYFEPVVETLRHRGWVDGRNITLLVRGASSDPMAADGAAGELLAKNADVILAAQSPRSRQTAKGHRGLRRFTPRAQFLNWPDGFQPLPQDYGKPADFLPRFIDRWLRQYRASQTDHVPEMEQLAQWLQANLPPAQTACVMHGDFRLGNMRRAG